MPITQAARQTAPDHDPKAEAFHTAEKMAARIVARLGTKDSTQAFIDDEDFTETAPEIADVLLGDRGMSMDEYSRINKIISAKLTKAEWSLQDKADSARNYYALVSLEAGIIIGVELERARARHGLKGGR